MEAETRRAMQMHSKIAWERAGLIGSRLVQTILVMLIVLIMLIMLIMLIVHLDLQKQVAGARQREGGGERLAAWRIFH